MVSSRHGDPSLEPPRGPSTVEGMTSRSVSAQPSAKVAAQARGDASAVQEAPVEHRATKPGDVMEGMGRERFSNRELSWLEFSARLLELAEDPTVPLLERVKF